MQNFVKIRELIQVWDNSFGFSTSEITQTEKKLGVGFPEVLFSYYEQLGNHPINFQQDSLLLPFREGIPDYKKMYIEDNYLIFYRENQSTRLWGIKSIELNMTNPPVYRKENDEKSGWVKDTDTLAMFLNSVSFWQYNVGFANRACKIDVPNKDIEASLKLLRKEDFIFKKWYVEFYRNTINEMVAVHRIYEDFTSDTFAHLYITCRNTDRFEELINLFNIEWDDIEHDN